MFKSLNIAEFLRQYITPERVNLAIRVILILLIGVPLLRLLRRLVRRMVTNKLSPQSEQLITRTVYYVGILVLLITLLNEFGFKLSAILGAAGVFGIAIGFASQTSFSNIISGIFLISERPFVVGDLVQIGPTMGTIVSIDLLSIKLNTPDNKFVRVPNETMIKTEVTNLTRHSERRVNLAVSISYKDDPLEAMRILKDIAASEALALKTPAALVELESFGNDGINIMYGVWGSTDDYMALRTNLMVSIKESFEKARISIPYPHIAITSDATTEPVKIQST